ncbi:glycoside hydrolase family 38 C-terminal domain-containing protein [Cognatiyoonia sp. IB215446]|uniref:alpha-mannosidase n=1 Tax=Cognatiyoonia sp. IB215446 TaxID=3097355 RepID=UPI002A12F936|nr:glycoside hydrolase family 38 C-terminal domain-containing protein [Cognatiyoonia sp. IB215446]MDX8347853.1 glycoside hydrolase family 38 C-terminal domain-containing protein [Cognatiyoonia sp. IB215446]
MKGKWPFTAEKIATRLDLIAPHIFRRREPLPHFRLLPLQDAHVDAPICADPTGWEEIPHQSYWGRADLNFVMKSHFTVPPDWDAQHLALHLPLGGLGDIFNHPEALVHIDTLPIGSADRHHHTIRLDPWVQDGQRHTLSLHGWTGLAGWPPDPESKTKLFMGTPALVQRDPALLAFHQLASTALDVARVLDEESSVQAGVLAALDDAFRVLDTRHPLGAAFYASVTDADKVLRRGIAAAGAPLDVTLNGIGHAHMDVAYLWPIAQIRLKNARTYTNVLRLMEDDPDYLFSHSQPQLYAYTAEDYPALFARIKDRVAEGRWEVLGGTWVEPDMNIPGPEALVRQLVLGRQYYRDTFGDVETPVLWLPDTFGFPSQVPQLMRHAGLPWFLTNKLNWNQRNPVPWSTHLWEGIDGSRVLAHVLTTPRDVQYLPFPTNYKSDLSAAEVLGSWTNAHASEKVRTLPICYGYGDGGGGPTEDLLAKAHAYAAMPGMPRMQMQTVRATFEHFETLRDDLPIWRGEHYMEGHRGVFTSQAWIKRANRKAEWALHEAEALAAMAGTMPNLDEAWRLLSLNQFHDIITGTSVPQVFADACKDFATIGALVEKVTEDASAILALDEVAVANTSPVTGPRLALVPSDAAPDGQPVEGGSLVHFPALPPYSITPISQASAPEGFCECNLVRDGAILENASLRVVIRDDGQIASVYDKAAGRDVLQQGALGNQWQAFEDRPICWDAWDIDPFFEDRMEVVNGATALEVVENGPLRASLRWTLDWRGSRIAQIIRLCAHSNRVDFETEVDWHEKHTLLKVAFPTSVDAPVAQCDIQWGVIERSNRRDTAFDAARFEVPAQKWVQLADETLGVAVLNDCKYGYDIHDQTIRLTLIKSSTTPDPEADQGSHEFTYSLLPIAGAHREVLDQAAYDLNAPIRVLPATGDAAEGPAFVISNSASIVVETLKPAFDGAGVVLRAFEAKGIETEAHLTFAKAPLRVCRVNFLEEEIDEVDVEGRSVSLRFGRFEIISLRAVFAGDAEARE